MRRRRPSCVLLSVLILTGGCSASTDSETEVVAEARRYDARAVYATTSYGLAPGYAWSSDDASLLVQSDSTGIFNAYAMAASDGATTPLTTSTADSVFAVSWFPDDDRVLVTSDKGTGTPTVRRN